MEIRKKCAGNPRKESFKQAAVAILDTYWTPEENPAGRKGPASHRNPLQPLSQEKLDLRRVELLASAMRMQRSTS